MTKEVKEEYQMDKFAGNQRKATIYWAFRCPELMQDTVVELETSPLNLEKVEEEENSFIIGK